MSDLFPIQSVCGARMRIVNLLSRYVWEYTITPSLSPAPDVRISYATTNKTIFTPLDTSLFLLIETVPVLLHMSSNIVDAFSDALIPAWREQPSTSLPEQWRIVLTMNRLSEILFPGVTIKELQVQPAIAQSFHTSADSLCAEMAVGHNQGRIAIKCDFLDLTRWGVDFSKFQCSRRSAQLPPCCMDIGFLPILFTVSEFSALNVGDAIVIGEAIGDDVLLKGRILGFGEFDLLISINGRTTIKELRMTTEHEEQTMISSEKEDETHNQQALLADAFASLPVTLEASLGKIKVPLEYIRDLGPGAVLEHLFDLTNPVVIYANGVRFGTGTLIRIGDMVGVQIKQWSSKQIEEDYA